MATVGGRKAPGKRPGEGNDAQQPAAKRTRREGRPEAWLDTEPVPGGRMRLPRSVAELERARPPQFGQPVEVGCFSKHADKSLTYDRSELRALTGQILPVDLNDGFSQAVPKWPDRTVLRPVLKVTMDRWPPDRPPPGIVCWRGDLTKIFLTPYQPNTEWESDVQLIDGRLLALTPRKCPAELAAEAAKSQRQAQMEYWGYKYEQYATAPRATDPALRATLLSAPVNPNVAFCSIVRTRLGPVDLIFGAEVDAISENRAQPGSDKPVYVELKTSKQFVPGSSDPDQARLSASFYRYKLLRIWMQSFLAGVPRIRIGFRDDAGRLVSQTDLNTLELPTLARSNVPRPWSGSAVLVWAGAVLGWLLKTAKASAATHPTAAVHLFRLIFSPASKTLSLVRYSVPDREVLVGPEFEAWVQAAPGPP